MNKLADARSDQAFAISATSRFVEMQLGRPQANSGMHL